jgi:hypothetical protein
MMTVLEECTTEEQCSILRYLWAKGLNVKDIHKEMFPVYEGKCLSRKAVHNWVTKFFQGRLKVARQGAKVADGRVQHFYIAGFDALVKR